MSKSMKKGAMLAALVMSIGLAGCATTDGLADRVSALESAVSAAQSAANAAASAASDASSAAQGAQNTANQAMQAASGAQACCDANGERISRMFEKASSK
ncbi:MAG: Lpp/OprI family alanine-zipper lipoprotein [Gammaproteobacteria bacterium]|nr:Lpp/OprI family alanine-zipper lipoprotein [Gammaproteobacteria bacterium]MCZ6761795.1 Lpp/OprI family alanine-zipper lipoprotein [Gammaproteobacteria bacterium]MCZ6880742.1 Lpp/OprI family alanine-zipper lipoprotein [Gammaproteobacteria bacterium]